MTGIENKTHPIKGLILAAFCYETLKRREVFQKISDTHYWLPSEQKRVHYRSLHTLDKARKNESV